MNTNSIESKLTFLERIATDLCEQNSQSTQDPIYCIQKKVIRVGLNPEYALGAKVGWFDCEGRADRKKEEALERYYQKFEKEPDGWTRTYYEVDWEFTEQFYLTLEAAQAAICKDENLRVYIGSAHRNHELKEIRRLLSGPIRDCVKALYTANEFITNGIDLGFIRMPDKDVADSAHATPAMLKAALNSLAASPGEDSPSESEQDGSMQSRNRQRNQG